MEDNILERTVLHAGKTFINSGNTHADSYIIQSGEISAYIVDNNEKIEVERYGKNAIIGETNLLTDIPSPLNYEAITDVTVVKITRQDFEKKLKRVDKGMLRVIRAILDKLKEREKQIAASATQAQKINGKAREIVEHLLRGMPDERKNRYEDILLPHFNIMVKALEDLRTQEKHEKQRQDLENKVSELTQDTDETDITNPENEQGKYSATTPQKSED